MENFIAFNTIKEKKLISNQNKKYKILNRVFKETDILKEFKKKENKWISKTFFYQV